MPPPKHILDRRGVTAEEWAKGIRSKAQKDAIEKGGQPAPAAPVATPEAAPAAPKPATPVRKPGAGL